MKLKHVASTVAGLGFLFALGLAQPPAGAAMVPTPCPSCDQKNAQHGNGTQPAIYNVTHLCSVDTGEAGLEVSIGNPTGQPVPFDIMAFESGGIIGQRWTGNAPAHSTTTATMVRHVFLDIDRDHNITLTGTIGSRSIGSQLYQCPCLIPDTTTVVSSPPSSGGPPATTPGTTPGVPHPPAGTPGTSLTFTGTLPATGGTPWLAVAVGMLLVSVGLLVAAIFRKPWAEPES